jgi:hypothetical protein
MGLFPLNGRKKPAKAKPGLQGQKGAITRR